MRFQVHQVKMTGEKVLGLNSLKRREHYALFIKSDVREEI